MWTKPYYGVQHFTDNGYLETIEDYGSFTTAGIFLWPLKGFKPLMENNFDTVSQAKEACERWIKRNQKL